tara:strand:- start:7816 stop:9096 length:1281 start_codon:yes stop_codon:yes gene_type:complete
MASNILDLKNVSIAVIGLGYVGLPLAIAFAKKYPTSGFDISRNRIRELKDNFDNTLEVSKSKIKKSNLTLTDDINTLKNVKVFIVTVPTPVNSRTKPDLSFLESACQDMAKILKKNAVIIFESTVYPGCTEEICIPILEKYSNLKLNKDFFVGYSPERINPGDSVHTFEKINKVVSGSSEKSLNFIYKLYKSVIDAKVHKAASIKVAEASKVIENTQRDINIALMNELSEICFKLDIKTSEVLKASNTKWNFLNFRPGLVGGHCIGVDPYYLSYKSQQLGVNPAMILSGRKTNNAVVSRVVNQTLGRLSKKKSIQKILIMGISFKENCPDTRNSGSVSVIKQFNKLGITPFIHDPNYPTDTTSFKAKFHHISELFADENKFDAILLLVPHKEYLSITPSMLRSKLRAKGHVFDMTNALEQSDFFSL